MPSVSKKQHNFMAAIAHNPAFAKKVGVAQSVGKDFTAADKDKKFAVGGLPERINKTKTHHTDGGVPNLSIKKYAGFKGGGMATAAGGKIQQMLNKQLPKGVAKQGIAPESKQMGMLGMKKGGKVGGSFNSAAKVRKTNMVSMPGPKMAKGGIAEERMEPATMQKVKTSSRPQGIAKTGLPKGKAMPDFGPKVKDITGAARMAGGGVTRGDGIARKGNTKGKNC